MKLLLFSDLLLAENNHLFLFSSLVFWFFHYSSSYTAFVTVCLLNSFAFAPTSCPCLAVFQNVLFYMSWSPVLQVPISKSLLLLTCLYFSFSLPYHFISTVLSHQKNLLINILILASKIPVSLTQMHTQMGYTNIYCSKFLPLQIIEVNEKNYLSFVRENSFMLPRELQWSF